MRKLFLLLFICILQTAVAVDINKRTTTALSYISNGYVQYGCDELKKAAAMNDLAAQYYIAVCYENGIGFEKDMTQAFRMYRKAAERGLPDAMYHLASFYRNGIVVTKDANRENEWMQRYNQKGGKFLLSDLISIYNEGLKQPENFALNPNNSTNVDKKIVAQSEKKTVPAQTVETKTPIVAQTVEKVKNAADVDINIPVSKENQKNTFALIISNENYQEMASVPNAHNDGEIFAEYCRKTLGIPQNNVKYIADATLNGMRRQINWLIQVMDAYQGEANIIFYYAGHGIPDESTRASYLLPVDGYGSDVSSGYSLEKLYAELGSKPAKSIVILLDACFSGTNRDGSMLASARGVAIKAKQNMPQGNMIILSAAQGDETAYPYKEKGHGLFTYYLLKKLQETKGETTIGEIADYVTTEVKKTSIVINGKLQTPNASASPSLGNNWRNMKF